MNKIASRAIFGALLVGGFTLLGATAANAADTSGSNGVASGTQAVVGASTPVTIIGNAISLLGDSSSSSAPATVATPAAATAPAPASAPSPTPSPSPSTTTGVNSLLGGTQVVPDVAAPVAVTGNALTLIGDPSSTGTAPTSTSGSGSTTTGDTGILGDTQMLGDVLLPISVSGTSLTLVGDPSTGVVTPTDPTAPTTPGTPVVPSTPTDLGTLAIADVSSSVLASTGADVRAAGVLGLFSLLAGLGLAFVARRRAALR